MSRIFESQNQFVIRFPESVASLIEEYLDNPDGVEMPVVELELDRERKDVSQRIALKVAVNDEKFKATVMDLPTISSTFKTIDRINFFKSNDISELIHVHENEDECDNIYQDLAEKVMDKEESI
jgi:TATA-binding protein-associated factor Taf7